MYTDCDDGMEETCTANDGVFLGVDESISGPIYQLAWIGIYRDTSLLPTFDQLTCVEM